MNSHQLCRFKSVGFLSITDEIVIKREFAVAVKLFLHKDIVLAPWWAVQLLQKCCSSQKKINKKNQCLLLALFAKLDQLF